MPPTAVTRPMNVAKGIIASTYPASGDFGAVEPSAAASVDTSRDGARAEERESTGSTDRESMGSAARMARMVHESTRMQSADDAGEVGE